MALAHTLPGGWQAGRHAARPHGVPVPPPRIPLAVQCMGPAIFEDTTETDPEVFLWDMPVLSLQSPRGLVMWTAIMASWNLRNVVKFRDSPPTWDIFLTQWLCILARWHEHPAPTLPTAEVWDMHKAITSLKETGSLQHPRLNQPHPSLPRLRNLRPRKRKKEIYGPAMAAAHQKVIDEYEAEGWEAIYPDGSSETHPEAGMVGGSGYFSVITGTRHNAFPSIKNKQTTGGNSWLPYMPFATEHRISAH